jgi:hypothetical protein
MGKIEDWLVTHVPHWVIILVFYLFVAVAVGAVIGFIGWAFFEFVERVSEAWHAGAER